MENETDCQIKCVQIYLNMCGLLKYQCEICNFHIDPDNLIQHVQQHFNTLPYKCHICKRPYLEYRAFLKHIQKHYSPNNTKGKEIEEIEEIDVTNHIENSAVTEQSKDITNPFIIHQRTERKTSRHKPISLIQNTVFLCFYCNKEFNNPHKRLNHLMGHIKQISKCLICDIGFKDKLQLNTHRRQFHSFKKLTNKPLENWEKEEKLEKSIIKSNRNDDQKHTAIMKEDDRKNASNLCDICQESFECKNSFHKHIMEHKIGIIPMINTNARIKRNRKPMEERRVCPICGKSLSTLANLNKHILVHTTERKFECHLCKKQFSQSHYLKAHIRIHTTELPYKCTICDRGFHLSGSFSKHMLRHNNIRRHACTFCDKKFFDSYQLRSHNRMHTGEKPFQCDVCKEHFGRRYCLNAHRILHTGEKPYKCDFDYCNKHFAQLCGKRNHMKCCKNSNSTQTN